MHWFYLDTRLPEQSDANKMFTSKYSSESEQMLNISINFIAHLIRQIDKNIFELIYINECRTQKSKSDVKTHSTDTCQMSQCFTCRQPATLVHGSPICRWCQMSRSSVTQCHEIRFCFITSITDHSKPISRSCV